jgi:hypothetical protein
MRVRIRWKHRPVAGGGEAFLSPMPVPVRAAVLAPGFAGTAWVRVFPDGWSREVEDFKPELLAAPLVELRRIAARVSARRAALPLLDYAVVAFTGAGQPALGEGDRDFFWQMFQVPLFEQYLSASGRTLAVECDAHDGLHILPSRQNSAELPRLVETARCPCGQPGPRLFSQRPAVLAAVAAGD